MEAGRTVAFTAEPFAFLGRPVFRLFTMYACLACPNGVVILARWPRLRTGTLYGFVAQGICKKRMTSW